MVIKPSSLFEFLFTILSVGIILPLIIFYNNKEGEKTFKYKTNKGNTLLVKNKDVSCKKNMVSIRMVNSSFYLGNFYKPKKPQIISSIKCKADWVLTDVKGKNFTFSSEKKCTLDSQENLPCILGAHFKKYNPNEKWIIGKGKVSSELKKNNKFNKNINPTIPIPRGGWTTNPVDGSRVDTGSMYYLNQVQQNFNNSVWGR